MYLCKNISKTAPGIESSIICTFLGVLLKSEDTLAYDYTIPACKRYLTRISSVQTLPDSITIYPLLSSSTILSRQAKLSSSNMTSGKHLAGSTSSGKYALLSALFIRDSTPILRRRTQTPCPRAKLYMGLIVLQRVRFPSASGLSMHWNALSSSHQ